MYAQLCIVTITTIIWLTADVWTLMGVKWSFIYNLVKTKVPEPMKKLTEAKIRELVETVIYPLTGKVL